MPFPKVVYVMGPGRSGSTVLGIALGNVPSVFYAGELHSWFIFKGVPRSEKSETLSFWRKVLARVPSAPDYFGNHLCQRLEHHRSLVHPRHLTGALLDAHESGNGSLFRAIAEESGCDYVVDSSHYPLRGGRLRVNKHLDVSVIHLVRNPVDVINALQKDVQRSKPMGVLKANFYSLTVCFLSWVQYRRFPRQKRVRVRYEDFIAEPCASVNEICERLGLPGRLDRTTDLPTGTIFQGNRVRNKETITITQQPMKRLLNPVWGALTCLLQLPVLFHHGYFFRRRRRGIPLG